MRPAALALALAAAAPPSPAQVIDFTERELQRIRQHSPLRALPADPTNAWADSPAAALFGQRLFFDTGLSRDGEQSCATCHVPEQDFTDGLVVAEGLAEGPRHTPALWNVAYQRWYFWDGRADTLWAQALQPIENPIELGGSRTAVARRIASDPTLRREYTAVFGPLPDEVLTALPAHALPAPEPGAEERTEHRAWAALEPERQAAVDRIFVHVGKAIAAYERRLTTRSSAFDDFVAGLSDGDPAKLARLSPAAQRGLRLFVGRGDCRTCHSGPLFSDGEFHDLGLPTPDGRPSDDGGRLDGLRRLLADPFNSAGPHSDAPDGARAARLGRLALRGDLWGQFKTPSLRNVARTPPYMHAGQFATLDDVVDFYDTLARQRDLGHHREQVLVPLRLTAEERADLLAFLHSLSDDPVDPALLSPP